MQATQKWESRFFSCPCLKIYTVEAVGLSLSNYTLLLKLQFLWVCEICCNFMKNLYFVNNHLNLKILLHICDTYNCTWLSTTHYILFLLNWFSVKNRFLSNFCVFIIKSPGITQRSVSQENALKKSKTHHRFFFFFFCKTMGSNIFFSVDSNWKIRHSRCHYTMVYGKHSPSCNSQALN